MNLENTPLQRELKTNYKNIYKQSQKYTIDTSDRQLFSLFIYLFLFLYLFYFIFTILNAKQILASCCDICVSWPNVQHFLSSLYKKQNTYIQVCMNEWTKAVIYK